MGLLFLLSHKCYRKVEAKLERCHFGNGVHFVCGGVVFLEQFGLQGRLKDVILLLNHTYREFSEAYYGKEQT